MSVAFPVLTRLHYPLLLSFRQVNFFLQFFCISMLAFILSSRVHVNYVDGCDFFSVFF